MQTMKRTIVFRPVSWELTERQEKGGKHQQNVDNNGLLKKFKEKKLKEKSFRRRFMIELRFYIYDVDWPISDVSRCNCIVIWCFS